LSAVAENVHEQKEKSMKLTPQEKRRRKIQREIQKAEREQQFEDPEMEALMQEAMDREGGGRDE
jgi:hypothetical protein